MTERRARDQRNAAAWSYGRKSMHRRSSGWSNAMHCSISGLGACVFRSPPSTTCGDRDYQGIGSKTALVEWEPADERTRGALANLGSQTHHPFPPFNHSLARLSEMVQATRNDQPTPSSRLRKNIGNTQESQRE